MLLQTTQTQATGEFFHAYRMGQQQPLVLLCLAVAHMQQAMRRNVDDRNRTVLQAFALLQVSLMHCNSVVPRLLATLLKHPCLLQNSGNALD